MISGIGSVDGSEDDPVIINAKEKRTTQTIGEGAYAFQPTLRLLFFKHHLEVVCCTFRYQTIQIYLAANLIFSVQSYYKKVKCGKI